MYRRITILVLVIAASTFGRDKLAEIEFFGYNGIDVEAVRAALPFHKGDKVSRNLGEQARAAVRQVTGREATDVARVCCVGDGDLVLFIGLPGTSSRTAAYDPAPQGRVAPPRELISLYEKMNRAEEAAISKGASEEESGGTGFRLLKEPRAHAAESAFHEYALRREDEIERLLESSGAAGLRAVAADALGYSARSPRQIAALTRAARDPDSTVRNNAVRALMELLGADPAAAGIPADTFIDMIRSGFWSDRNKSSMFLFSLTEQRDPQLLARLKAEASDALWEVARWRSMGWAYPARVILARIAGFPEDKTKQVAAGTPEAFVSALGQ